MGNNSLHTKNNSKKQGNTSLNNNNNNSKNFKNNSNVKPKKPKVQKYFLQNYKFHKKNNTKFLTNEAIKYFDKNKNYSNATNSNGLKITNKMLNYPINHYQSLKVSKEYKNFPNAKKKAANYGKARTENLRKRINSNSGFPNIKNNSGNIRVNMKGHNYTSDNTFEPTTISVGTTNSNAKLTNVYVVKTNLPSLTDPLMSIRYGTPLHADKVRFGAIVELAKKNKGLNNKKKPLVLVLSLMDHCRSTNSTMITGSICESIHARAINPKNKISKKSFASKFREHTGVKNESNTYQNMGDVQFMQLSCSGGVTNKGSAMGGRNNNYSILEGWLKSNKLILEFWNYLKTEQGMFSRSPTNIPRKRFNEFIALSIIRYCFKKLDKSNELIYLYHCKSGKDRTGLVFALDQTVIYFCEKNLGNKNMTNINTIKEFYNKISLPAGNDGAKFADLVLAGSGGFVRPILNRYLKRSYLITLSSTGYPGLKWGCKQKINPKNSKFKWFKKENKIGNPIAKLLDSKENVLKWCGVSSLVGS